MNKTQEHITIADIKEDLLILKDGGAALVLQTNAVNFGLLSEREQMAIIFSFGQMLNSLSYSIQIVIHSTRLDISSYLKLLDTASQKQTNPLLSQMIGRYKLFIQTTIKENEVLDKKFYIIVPLSNLEVGIGFKNPGDRIKKVKAMLTPRRDQIVKQLNRVGLKSNQLTSTELIKLFFGVYNTPANSPEKAVQIEPVTLSQPQVTPSVITLQTPQVVTPSSVIPSEQSERGNLDSTKIATSTSSPRNDNNLYPQKPRSHPFIVEELVDNI